MKSSLKKKTVTFTSKPDEIFYVDDAREPRDGSFWVTDRIRFNNRITETAKLIEPCLLRKIEIFKNL